MGLVAPQHVGSSQTTGIKPVSPALVDGFFTTEPSGRPPVSVLNSSPFSQGPVWSLECESLDGEKG